MKYFFEKNCRNAVLLLELDYTTYAFCNLLQLIREKFFN